MEKQNTWAGEDLLPNDPSACSAIIAQEAGSSGVPFPLSLFLFSLEFFQVDPGMAGEPNKVTNEI